MTGMTEGTASLAADAKAVAQAVDEIDAIRRETKRSVTIRAGAITAVGLVGTVYGFAADYPAIGAICVTGLAIYLPIDLSGASAKVRKAMSKSVMPILCRMAGDFAYARHGGPPEGLREAQILPNGALKSEDEVRGEIGGVRFAYWDVTVTDRQQNHKGETDIETLFMGIVVEAATGTGRDLALHVPRLSVRKVLSKIFGGETETKEVSAGGARLEADVHPGDYDMDALAAAAGALIGALPQGAKLEGILQRDGEAVIAVALGRDLYAMGGLFTSREDLMKQVEAAMRDLALPARIAATWAGAEAEVPRADGRPEAPRSGEVPAPPASV